MESKYRSGWIGSLDSSKPVTIVGAGVSGLLAAYYLKKKGFTVTVLEASHRVGGLIDTIETPWGIAETAAHSFVMSPALNELFSELKLEVVPVNRQHRARYILRKGKFRRFPLSVVETLVFVWRFFTRPLLANSTKTIEEWGQRHWGKAGTEFLLGPMVAGIYAGSLKKMSWTAAFPSIALASGRTLAMRCFDILRHRRRQKKSRPTTSAPATAQGMVVLRGGTKTLIQALEQELQQEIHLNAKVQNLSGLLENGGVVLTVPATAAADLLAPPFLLPSGAADATNLYKHEYLRPLVAPLQSVEYIPLITSTVFLDRGSVPGFREGVGVLIPSTQGYRARGILFNSSAFDGRLTATALNKNILSITLMLGGADDPEVLNLSDEDLKNLIQVELSRIFGLREPVVYLKTTRWPGALPHYTLALESFWTQAHHALALQPGLVLFGNYTGQVSIRGLVETLARL